MISFFYYITLQISIDDGDDQINQYSMFSRFGISRLF